MRTICKPGLVAVFLIVCVPGSGAERIRAGASPEGQRNGAEFVVPLPVAPEVYEPRVTEGARSSATLHTQDNCPTGTWRWHEPEQSRIVELPVATSLIVRLERDDDASATTPDQATRLSTAAEKIVEAFRARLPMEAEFTPAAGKTLPEPVADPKVVQALAADTRSHWETQSGDHQAEAAAALTEALDMLDGTSVRLTATVAREEAIADCARIEVCEAGQWILRGHRAKTVRRRPLPPVFFGPAVISVPEQSDAAPVATAAIADLEAWLRAHYLSEAIAGALLANASDPCAIAAVTNPENARQLAASDR